MVLLQPDGDINRDDLRMDIQNQLNGALPTKEKNTGKGTNPDNDDMLKRLLTSHEQLIEAAGKPIVKLPPIMTLEGEDLFKRYSINLIQGAQGSHKSRLAENFVAMMIAGPQCSTDFWGFEKHPNESFSVVYLDTERNSQEELPAVIQKIRRLAGYDPRKELKGLFVNTIKGFDRSDRQQAAETYLAHVRSQVNNHLVVILDVITDCLSSFNREDASLKLYDFLGNLCEDHDCTVIAVIHENPGSEKARGHTGTEGWNKASTVLRIGSEKTNDGEETPILKMRFLKLRHGPKPSPIYLKYCSDAGNLVQAESYELQGYGLQTDQEADKSQPYCDALEGAFKNQTRLDRKAVLTQLSKSLRVSDRTIDTHLKRIIDNESRWINNTAGDPCILRQDGGQGSKVEYYLESLDENGHSTFENEGG